MPKHTRRPGRYRYILNSTAVGSDSLSDFRLIAGNNIAKTYHGQTALRVHIPRDVKLTKYASDNYSTTTDNRTLDDIGYDFMIRDEIKKKWVIRNEFKEIPPFEVTSRVASNAIEKKKVGASS